MFCALYEFSSPLGVIYISIRQNPMNRNTVQFSSPLGVIYISIPWWGLCGIWVWFSSPLGVIYISICQSIYHEVEQSGFRPLSGSSISQSVVPESGTWSFEVFVPSRGHLYLNAIGMADKMISYRVFVPSRGHLYLNKRGKNVCIWKNLFSSPLGVIYISINPGKLQNKTFCVFVPSRGHLYLNRLSLPYGKTCYSFSSPLGVIYISMYQKAVKE